MRLRSGFIIWLFTVWFALLQAAAPLMHAHVNSNFDMDDGPHMHVAALHLQQEEPVNSQHAFHWHVHANQDTGMTVGLTPVVTEQGISMPDMQPVWLFWLLLPMLVGMLAGLLGLKFSPASPLVHRRRRHHLISPSTPRAPPAC